MTEQAGQQRHPPDEPRYGVQGQNPPIVLQNARYNGQPNDAHDVPARLVQHPEEAAPFVAQLCEAAIEPQGAHWIAGLPEAPDFDAQDRNASIPPEAHWTDHPNQPHNVAAAPIARPPAPARNARHVLDDAADRGAQNVVPAARGIDDGAFQEDIPLARRKCIMFYFISKENVRRFNLFVSCSAQSVVPGFSGHKRRLRQTLHYLPRK